MRLRHHIKVVRVEKCSICTEPFNVPIDLDWRFAFSPFVLKTLVQRNGLTVLWALGELFEPVRAGGKSAYLPEVDLLDYQGTRATKREIDILAMCEGQYIAVEAKKSAEGFLESPDEIEKFITIVGQERKSGH